MNYRQVYLIKKSRRSTKTPNNTTATAVTSDSDQMSPSLIFPKKSRVFRRRDKSSVRLNYEFDSTL